jgi:hypothetical protein
MEHGGKIAGAFRVETLPKRPHGLRLRSAASRGACHMSLRQQNYPPQSYALTLIALPELL